MQTQRAQRATTAATTRVLRGEGALAVATMQRTQAALQAPVAQHLKRHQDARLAQQAAQAVARCSVPPLMYDTAVPVVSSESICTVFAQACMPCE